MNEAKMNETRQFMTHDHGLNNLFTGKYRIMKQVSLYRDAIVSFLSSLTQEEQDKLHNSLYHTQYILLELWDSGGIKYQIADIEYATGSVDDAPYYMQPIIKKFLLNDGLE